MQLLDEIRGKLPAIQWEPTLDPEGRRAVALERLIRRIQVVEAEALRDQRDARSAESAGQVRPTERYLGLRRPYLSGVHTGGRTQNRIRVRSEAYHRPLRLVRAAPIPLAADHA